MSLAEFFVISPHFLRKLKDVSNHPMFRTNLELSIINDPETAQEFMNNLLSLYMWILEAELEVKKQGLNPSEYAFSRGIITRLIRNFVYPFLMISKKRLEKNLRILGDWLGSIRIQLQELGLQIEDYEIEYPPSLLEMRSLEFIRMSDYFYFSVVPSDSTLRKMLTELITEGKRVLARFNLYRQNIVSFARYYPETTVSLPRLKEILDIVAQFWDNIKFPLAPPDFISMLSEFYLVIKASTLILEELVEFSEDDLKEKIKWGPRNFRGVIYYFTDESCPGCKALESIRDFWDLIAHLEANKYKVIITERTSLEGKMLFDACFVKATPSLLYGILFLHGIKVPKINPKNKEERKHLLLYFRKIFQEFWLPPIQTVEFRNLLDLQKILESPLLKYEREYILRTYK